MRLSKKDKAKLADLDLLSIVNASGERIPLSNFAHYEETTSPVTILRENQARVVHITAKPVAGLSLDKVQDTIQKLINENIFQR